MRSLVSAGIEFDCFEASDRVGGHWHTDYDCLHLITPRSSSGFRGDPMPDHWPDFPRRDLMLEYLEGHADRFDLRPKVTFNTPVTKIAPLGPNAAQGWRVTAGGRSVDYSGVIVANGHNTTPRIPELPGDFSGKTVHSGKYRNPGDIVGDRVLVVGSGNSGCDIASELAQANFDVEMSIRRGHLFQPKSFYGKPRGTLKVMKLPPVVLDPVLRAMIRISVGRPENYGLPTPQAKSLNLQPPVVNSLVLHWIQHGRIVPRPEIARLDGDQVEFVDGHRSQFDTIVWATGFLPTLPFLPEQSLHLHEGMPLKVAGSILPAHGPGRLYFVGLCAPRGPQLPVYSDQAEVIVDMIRLQESSDRLLVDLFTATDRPEWRIDQVRAVWNTEMKKTRNRLGALARRTRQSQGGAK